LIFIIYIIEKDVLRTDRTIPMYSNNSENYSSDNPEIYDDIDTDTSQAGWNSNLEILRDILISYTFLENDNGIFIYFVCFKFYFIP